MNRMIDFRDYLKEDLEQKIKKNPSYSLRSYSAKLAMNPGLVSRLIRKQVPLTEKIFNKLKPHFPQLSEKELIEFSATTKISKKHVQQIKLKTLDEAYLDSIGNWHTIAVLESLNLNPQPSSSEIAVLLNISETTIQSDLENLIQANLIEKNDDGKFNVVDTHRSTVPLGEVKKSLTQRQIEVLEKSIESLEEDDPQMRDHATITLAIDPSLVPIAAQKLREYRRELATWLDQNSKNKTHVYEITTGLFPLTKWENINDDKN